MRKGGGRAPSGGLMRGSLLPQINCRRPTEGKRALSENGTEGRESEREKREGYDVHLR